MDGKDTLSDRIKDGYKLTVAANYPNNPKLVKQEILLDKNSNIKSVTVIDKDGNKDPYMITFIYKTGLEHEIEDAKKTVTKE